MNSQQPKLKVCGLTQLDQIQELISMNTDFLGFIFYERSPRYVLNHLSLEDISSINHQGKVGVFVNQELEKVIEITTNAKLNYIQLHGNENENYVTTLKEKLDFTVGIIKVIRMGNQSQENKDRIEKIFSGDQSSINYYLFDTDSKAFGGTGKQFDWNILNEIKIPLPYFLSGGISGENIDTMKMLIQKPFALDINSKFEIEPGNKDLQKISLFKAKI